MRLPAELLVLACLIVGVAPALTVAPILDTAARAVLGSAMPEYSLRLWHGITPELLMSIVAMAGGLGVYVMLRSYLLSHEGPPLLGRINGKRIFDWVLVTLSWRLARWLATNLGTRRLQPQLRLLAGVAFVAALLPLYARGLSLTGPSEREFDLVFGLLWVVGVGCAVGTAVQAKFHRVVALILLGTAGLVTCVSFVWLSAPDVALTQIVVETVTTVLLLLGLRWLPKRIARPGPAEAPDSIRWHRVRDFSIALLAGLGLATLALAAMQLPDNHSISRYFVENAYTKGGGTNVVNVILVDFRGFDTLGEITVLAVVALTVFALLRRFRPAPESIPVPEQQHVQDAHDEAHPDRQKGDTAKDTLATAALMMGLLFPVIGVVAIFLLLRGHDLPGGGFVAGIAMATAFILQYMARGTVWVEARLHVMPVRWMGFGLLLAGFAGAAACVFGHPFLTSYFAYAELPLLGRVPTASALLFDIGVFSLVVGATVLMLIAIAHQSLRRYGVPLQAGQRAPDERAKEELV
jgi:multicomponent K+:H+ antiporter subunit A